MRQNEMEIMKNNNNKKKMLRSYSLEIWECERICKELSAKK